MKIKFSLRQKAVCAILLLAFALAVAATAVSYRTYSASMDAHFKTMSANVAKTAAAVVDSGEVRRYADAVKAIYLKDPAPEFEGPQSEASYLARYDGLKDGGYWRLYDTLVKIKTSGDVLSLYIIYVDAGSKTCVYIVDGDNTENNCPVGTWDVIYEQNYGVFDNPELGFPAYITDTDEFGWLASTGTPVLAEDGTVIAYVMVDMSMDSMMCDRQNYLVRLVLVLAGVTAVLILLFIRVVNSAVVKPVNKLAEAAASYIRDRENTGRADSLSLLERLEIRTGDEVENLSNAMKQMERDIGGYIRNLTAVTAEKERIGAELGVATKIQASMLPSIFPPFPERDEFDIYATMQPAKEVGGDFYDFFLVNGKTLGVVMADVSGKGVPAALFMVIAKTLIKNNAQNGLSPGEVFETVNGLLCENNEAGMFVTAFMGYLDIESGRFTFVNAGHNPPLLRTGGEWIWLKGKRGFVLAGMENMRYKQDEIVLRTGDELFLYTDGVTEAMNKAGKLFTEARLLETVNGNGGRPLTELLASVKRGIDIFADGAEQADDITMLSLRYRGGVSE